MKKLSLLSTLLLFLAGLLPNLQTTANNTINKHPHLLANNKNVSYSINTDCDNQIPDIEWQNTIGGNGDESLSVIRPTADGGYILGGSSYSGISGNKTESSQGLFDYWVVKLSAIGIIEWQNTIGGNEGDYLTAIQQTTDGGYILGGYSWSDISGDKTETCNGWDDYWVVKLTATGTIEWQNTIGGDDWDLLQNIEQTVDGGYIIGGTSNSGISGDKTDDNKCESADYWIVKLNSGGSVMWQRTIGGYNQDEITAIKQTNDGGYIIGGSSISSTSGDKTQINNGNFDYWVLKLSASGNIVWQSTIGGNGVDFLTSIEQTIDGGYLLGGYSNSDMTGDKTTINKGGYDYWVIKLSLIGTIEWQKTIGSNNNDNLSVANQIADGSYILGGSSASNLLGDKTEENIGQSDYWIIKLSAVTSSNIAAKFTAPAMQCLNTPVIFTNISIGATSYQWQVNGIPVSIDTHLNYTFNTPGLQTITLIASDGICTNLFNQNINITNPPNINFTHSENGLTTTLTAPAWVNGYTWHLDDGTTNTTAAIEHTYSIAGTYNVCITTQSTCSDDTLCQNITVSNLTNCPLPATNIEWQNTIGGSLSDYLQSMQQTADGGYILGGNSYSNISSDKTEVNLGSGDYWIVKTSAEGVIEWQNTIGGSGNDDLRYIQQTSDGGYIVGGYSNSTISGDKTEINQGNGDYWIVKLSATGTIEWQNTIGSYSTDVSEVIIQTTDGGYIVGGYSLSGASGDKTEASQGGYDYWIIKLSNTGNIEWQNTIGGSSTDYLLSINQTTDGGYIVGGHSNSTTSGDKTEASQGSYDNWIIKLSSTGAIEWQKTIGGDNTDYLSTIEQTTDSGYIVGGYSNSNISGDKSTANQGGYDYWVIKLTPAGTIEWQKTIGGSADDKLLAMQQTADGGYILGGYSQSGISGDKTSANIGSTYCSTCFDYWVVKLSDTGILEWQNIFGGYTDDYLQYIHETINGGYILGGYSNSNIEGNKTESSKGSYDYWVIQLPPITNPIANFVLPDHICINTTATFVNYSSNATNYHWQIDGVVVDSTANLNYVFTTDGIHTVTLVVDNGVCSSSKSQTVHVISSPNPNFAHTQNALTVNCIAQAGDNNYTWNFGDGNTAIGQSTSHTYTTAGTYSVCLTSNNSCATSSSCRNVTTSTTANCVFVPSIEWQNTIGGSDNDILKEIQQTSDGGYILGGYSLSGASGDKTEATQGYLTHDYWIVKLSSGGTIEWQNTIGGNNYDYLQSIQQTTDGGYIVGGTSFSGMSGDKTEGKKGEGDYWIIKLSPTGSIQWQNTIGGSGNDDLQSIQQTTDDGYIVGGTSSSGISGDKTDAIIGGVDYWIIKLNSNGTIVSQKTIGGMYNDFLANIKQTADGGYILGGYSSSDISGDKTEDSQGYLDYWVIKLSATGIIEWQNTIGGDEDDYLTDIQQTVDGGYIIGGYSNSNLLGDKLENNKGYNDYWAIKLTPTGIIEWQNSIGGSENDMLNAISQTDDGGYILGGYSGSDAHGDKTESNITSDYLDYWIVKLSGTGYIEWQNTIGGNLNDYVNSIQKTSDGGCVLGGYSNSIISGDKLETTQGNYDYWVLKLSPTNTLSALANFSLSYNVPLCTYTPITIANNSTNATSYQWQIDGVAVDTTTNLSYTFTTIGAHIITLVASNGECSTSYSKTITLTESMVMLQAKALLQCSITDLNVGNALMTTEFNSTLPTQQPFNAAPWNYTGTESGTIPANAVDWVLVELRNSANINQVVARKAVLLLNDGSLQDVGTPLQNNRVAFVGLANNQSYFVVLRHRSHQTIASSVAVPVSNNLMSIDFTQSADQTNGGAASLAYINGMYALKLVLTPTLSGNTTVCSGTTQTYTNSTPVAGVTYTWTATGGNIVSGQGGNSVQVLWANGTSGTLTLTAEEHLCSEVASVSITVSLTPDAIITVGGTAAGGGTPGVTSYNLCPTCKVYLKSNYTNLTNYTLKWYKNNNELTQYQNYLGGYVKKAGNYKLKVIRNSTGCEDFSQTVTVTGGAPMLTDNNNPNINNTPSMGKEEELLFESENLELFVYPNPAQNRVTIAYNIADNSQLSLKIYDIMGQLQHAQTLAISNNTLDVDVSTYPSGTYLVQLLGDKGSVVSYLTVVK
jgi:PKD repeat protein